ncbi:MAG: response regulator [Mycobacteriaceae bacterium]|nr:response regulator [Mycobacteriaceae bacterium]
MTSQKSVRCVIVDDNQEFLDAAAGVLERGGISVVGMASSVDEALTSAARLRPDVVLVDVDLGVEDGFELAARLHRQEGAAVILTSTHAQQDFEELIANSPVAGFVQKAALSGPAIRRMLLRNRT